MSKWKTTQRRGKSFQSTDSIEDDSHYSFEESVADGPSLGFLDDMLSSSRHSINKNTSGNSNINARRESRTPPPAAAAAVSQKAQIKMEVIDDILHLVSGADEDYGNSKKMQRSSSYGIDLERKDSRDTEPISSYLSKPSRSSLRPLNRYGSGSGLGTGISGSGGNLGQRPGSRDQSPEPQSDRMDSIIPLSRNIGKLSSSGGNQYLPRRGSRDGMKESTSKSPINKSRKLSSKITPMVGNTKGNFGPSSFDLQNNDDDDDDDDEDDNLMPIPVFQVNTDDDDTISCITTSVTSYYDTSSRSPSFPWSRRGQKSATSQGEASYADTLDELADMLHPNQNGRTNVLNSRLSKKGTQTMDDFFKPPRVFSTADDVFGTNSDYPLQSDVVDDSPTIDPDEIYRGTRQQMRRPSQYTSWVSYLEPCFSQTRFLLRYWISILIPRNWRWKNGGSKDDDEQGYLGTWDPKINRKLVPRSKRQQVLWQSVICSVSGLFFIMTLTILLLRLTWLHAPTIRASAIGKLRAVAKRQGFSNKKKFDTGNAVVLGGMTKRMEESEGGGTTSVVGGMAQHDVDEVNAISKSEKETELVDVEELDQDHIGLELPKAFRALADLTDLPVRKGLDAPFYWHIPRSGGGTVNDIFGGCLSLTLASDAGGGGPAGKENKLQRVRFTKHFSYVNVDTTTPAGIERARKLDLIGSGLADITVSSLLYEASSLFSDRHRGRLFTIIRHPVERAVSLFHYVQDTQWRRRQSYQKELSELTIEEYFESGLAENNWMTRYLVNEPTKGELTIEDLNLAKEILRRKCLVGLLSEKGESFARFERYFGFQVKDTVQKECHEKKLQWAWSQKHRHDIVEENTPLWDLIMTHNLYDMQLYRYASEVLFVEQAALFK